MTTPRERAEAVIAADRYWEYDDQVNFGILENDIAAAIKAAEDEVRKSLGPVWRSMDTAPKDGTRVLLTDGKFVGTGAWREEYNGARGEHEFIWSIDGEQGDTCPWANDYMKEPKGWQPLPDAALPADMVVSA